MAKESTIKVFCQSRLCYCIGERAILNPVARWYCKCLQYPKQVDISYNALYCLKHDGMRNREATFTALPGGNRNNNGTFNNIGNNGNWWSSTENDINNAINRNMNYNDGNVNSNNNNKEVGFSVRCLRD